MRRAATATATVLSLFAGAASIEHGIFEILQGTTRPETIMITSMGPPCQPEQVWNACEPAMTIIPSFLTTGILAVISGIITLIWAVGFMRRKGGGLVLILLTIPMLLFGGGFFPPLIGIVGGVVGTRIHAPLRKPPRRVGRLLAASWPWLLALFAAWLIGQWIIGYFFGEFLLNNAILVPIVVLGLLGLTVAAASARDRQPFADSDGNMRSVP